jgi:hypothetical protein
MHLLRLKAKPHAQHGAPSSSDPSDPTAVNTSRNHGLPAQPPRIRSSIWKSLPFISGVSDIYTS